MGLERELGVAHVHLGEIRGEVGLDALALVDGAQLRLLGVGVSGERLALDAQLSLEQLALRLHGDELTSSH